jgi:hypothetical protein
MNLVSGEVIVNNIKPGRYNDDDSVNDSETVWIRYGASSFYQRCSEKVAGRKADQRMAQGISKLFWVELDGIHTDKRIMLPPNFTTDRTPRPSNDGKFNLSAVLDLLLAAMWVVKLKLA